MDFLIKKSNINCYLRSFIKTIFSHIKNQKMNSSRKKTYQSLRIKRNKELLTTVPVEYYGAGFSIFFDGTAIAVSQKNVSSKHPNNS